jgi:hypothetical protein
MNIMGSFLAAAGLELISSLERDMTGFSAIPHTRNSNSFFIRPFQHAVEVVHKSN